ncbi:MAG: arabinogalactan endo-1,4-beta-galactosidase [Pseudobutyrivibrio sp.]|nr:arabinogalactan endo-1,4-beta-galactosidase [Pseudobutyrivibrio sp.]
MDYIKGMDISSYQEMLDKGYEYYDEDGKKVDILKYAVEKGFNYARVRIWNNPLNVPESGGYCSLEETIKLARKIKEIGIPYLLDFHYSDWWADPGNQKKPKDWEYLSGIDLINAVYSYTKEVLNVLSDNGVSPSMVQVGNEIRCGMLWPDGNSDDYRCLVKLINAGIKGVKDSNNGKNIKIMLHLDQGGRYHYFEEWFDGVIRNGLDDFDVIGLSYYPFWHGTYQDLDDTLTKLEKRYKKDLIIAEVAYGYRLGDDSLFGKGQERLGGYKASEDGQFKAMQIISGLIHGVDNSRGKGFFYWEPFMRSNDSSGWGYCMGLVDENGNPLKTLKEMKTAFPIDVDDARNMYSKVKYTDDSTKHIEGKNVIRIDGFKNNLEGWNYSNPDNVDYEITEENNVFKFGSTGNVKFELSQNQVIENTGNYKLAVDYRGDNTTGVSVKLFIKFPDYRREINIYPSDKMWTKGILDVHMECGTEVEMGVEVDSPKITGEIRNVALYLEK